MQPLVSIVIPHYNHSQALFPLFDSILSQSLKALEVVIVDDCSETSPEAIVKIYRHKGLEIRLIHSATRLYTKNARLVGIREARAPVIAIADADDVLWGTDVLERHVSRLQSERADVLHFRSILTDTEKNFAQNFGWADPRKSRLEGKDIFAQYALSGLRGFSLWNKLYSKTLWMRFWDTAWNCSISRYTEDIYLNSLCMFHASIYIGSEYVGYGWQPSDKRKQDSFLRSLHAYLMLKDLIPYFLQHDGDPKIIDIFGRHMRAYFRRCAGRMCLALSKVPQENCLELMADGMQNEADILTQIKMLILATGLNAMQIEDAEISQMR